MGGARGDEQAASRRAASVPVPCGRETCRRETCGREPCRRETCGREPCRRETCGREPCGREKDVSSGSRNRVSRSRRPGPTWRERSSRRDRTMRRRRRASRDPAWRDRSCRTRPRTGERRRARDAWPHGTYTGSRARGSNGRRKSAHRCPRWQGARTTVAGHQRRRARTIALQGLEVKIQNACLGDGSIDGRLDSDRDERPRDRHTMAIARRVVRGSHSSRGWRRTAAGVRAADVAARRGLETREADHVVRGAGAAPRGRSGLVGTA